MIVAASTECFSELSLPTALQKLADLEYTNVEIAIDEQGQHLKPSAVRDNLENALAQCRNAQRLTPVAYSLNITAEGEEYYEQFAAICRLAKVTKVFTITIPSAELGTPFNAEVERLQRLVSIASVDGILVGIKSQIGRMSEDPDTVAVLCNNVKGLGLTLDPSHYICGPHQGRGYEQLLKYVYHVHLRDSTKTELQVRVGQGEIEYGKLYNQLSRHNYNRTLCAHVSPMEGVDHSGEMRKIRLLLESLLF